MENQQFSFITFFNNFFYFAGIIINMMKKKEKTASAFINKCQFPASSLKYRSLTQINENEIAPDQSCQGVLNDIIEMAVDESQQSTDALLHSHLFLTDQISLFAPHLSKHPDYLHKTWEEAGEEPEPQPKFDKTWMVKGKLSGRGKQNFLSISMHQSSMEQDKALQEKQHLQYSRDMVKKLRKDHQQTLKKRDEMVGVIQLAQYQVGSQRTDHVIELRRHQLNSQEQVQQRQMKSEKIAQKKDNNTGYVFDSMGKPLEVKTLGQIMEISKQTKSEWLTRAKEGNQSFLTSPSHEKFKVKYSKFQAPPLPTFMEKAQKHPSGSTFQKSMLMLASLNENVRIKKSSQIPTYIRSKETKLPRII